MGLITAIMHLSMGQFLVLYAVVIVLTLAACRWWVRRHDPTAGISLPPVPVEPNAYRIAYLRGGEEKVVRLAMFALVQRGFLEIIETRTWYRHRRWIARQTPCPPKDRLSGMGRTVFDFFSVERDTNEILESLPEEVERYCEKCRVRLETDRLLNSSAIPGNGLVAGIIGASIIFGLFSIGVAKAIENPDPRSGVMGVLCSVSMLCLVTICSKPRVTSLGELYLSRLSLTFDRLTDGCSESELVLGVAIFGISFLDGSEHFRRMFTGVEKGGHAAGGLAVEFLLTGL